ncbi:MAG: ATP synthase F0 subunit B [Kofleriaceae bacterium]
MLKLLLALMLVPTIAYAQPSEPKIDSTTHEAAGMQNTDSAGQAQEKKEADEDPDPSQHFNFFDFSYRGKDEYGGKFGDGVEVNKEGHTLHEEEPMSPPFVFMLINFAILVWLLIKYLLPAGQQVAAERHDEIQSALDEAAKLRDQAKQKLAEYEARVKGLDDEIKQLVDGIRADAEADKARIFEQAKAQSAQLQKEAEQRIAAEIELARNALTKEVTAAAAHATEKLLADKVTADDQRGLVTTFIKNVEAQRAS